MLRLAKGRELEFAEAPKSGRCGLVALLRRPLHWLVPKPGELMLSDIQIEAFGFSIAAFMMVVTAHIILLHGFAAVIRRRPRGQLGRLGFLSDIMFVLQVIGVLFAISVITNLLWGAFIHAMGVVPSFRNALFFSLENYTSLGLTRVGVDDRWRTLAPLISLSGIFCLGWTTAILTTLFSHVYMPKAQ